MTACVPKLQKVQQPAVQAVIQAPPEQAQNTTVVSTVEPKQETVQIASTPTTLYNDEKQKFQYRSYTLELMYVATDGSGCQIKINGKSNWYNKDEDVSFDEALKIRVMQAVPTHGYGGDACQIALFG